MSAIDECPICSNPAAATFEQRMEHGCNLPTDDYWVCCWCGEPHLRNPEEPRFHAGWCNAECADAHKAANPECKHFKGFIPISDTLPGGRYDGIWEESGLAIEVRKNGEEPEN